jgi:hypothetical protein
MFANVLITQIQQGNKMFIQSRGIMGIITHDFSENEIEAIQESDMGIMFSFRDKSVVFTDNDCGEIGEISFGSKATIPCDLGVQLRLEEKLCNFVWQIRKAISANISRPEVSIRSATSYSCTWSSRTDSPMELMTAAEFLKESIQ